MFATIVPGMFFVGAGIIYYATFTTATSSGAPIGTALSITGVMSFLLSAGMLILRYKLR